MSLPANDSSSLIIDIKNLRNSTKVVTYNGSNFVEKIDHILQGLNIGTVSQVISYDGDNKVSQSVYYYNGTSYQTETFTYGSSGEIISSVVALS